MQLKEQPIRQPDLKREERDLGQADLKREAELVGRLRPDRR